MDRGIGRILASLERHRLSDNTIVMFLSDNGATAEMPQNNKNKKTTLPTGPLGEVGCRDGYGPMWAAVSNTPYRQYKIETLPKYVRNRATTRLSCSRTSPQPALRGPLSQFRPIWTASRSTPTGIILRNFLRPRCGTSFPIPALPALSSGNIRETGRP